MYYRIKHSLDLKIIGQSSQIHDAKLPEGWDTNPAFIDNIEFQKVSFEPITPVGTLHKRSKLTDLISAVPAGFTRKLLISKALKGVFERFDSGLFQYFKCHVLSKDTTIEYWIVSPIISMFENVDFSRSDVVSRKRKPEGGTYLEPAALSTLNEFHKYLTLQGEDSWKTTIDHVYIKEGTVEDVFALGNVDGGVGYYASENFKKTIEQHGFTGIEFAPSNLNSIEWLHNERKNRYK
ncbi:hypothetical protein DBR40_12480 [Pedobacter sp. KBW01]|nr:hypothetical protein DBR40_12480 [Pedobacter sp. KBW01]